MKLLLPSFDFDICDPHLYRFKRKAYWPISTSEEHVADYHYLGHCLYANNRLKYDKHRFFRAEDDPSLKECLLSFYADRFDSVL